MSNNVNTAHRKIFNNHNTANPNVPLLLEGDIEVCNVAVYSLILVLTVIKNFAMCGVYFILCAVYSEMKNIFADLRFL